MGKQGSVIGWLTVNDAPRILTLIGPCSRKQKLISDSVGLPQEAVGSLGQAEGLSAMESELGVIYLLFRC